MSKRGMEVQVMTREAVERLAHIVGQSSAYAKALRWADERPDEDVVFMRCGSTIFAAINRDESVEQSAWA